MLNKHYVITPEFAKVIIPFLKLEMGSTCWEWLVSGIYLNCYPIDILQPDAGWIVRVNVLLDDAFQVLSTIVPVCCEAKIAFKVIGDPTLYQYAFSKTAPAEDAGKFITIYTPTSQQLTEIMNQVDLAISKLDILPCAPPVSDMLFSDNLSYRYSSYNPDSTISSCPDDLIVDHADYFTLPTGITDPFTGESGDTDNDIGTTDTSSVVVIENYEIEDVLHRNYATAIYKGKRVSDGYPIILKEARPNAYIDDVPATTRLENEYRVLTKIAESRCAHICPTPLDMFEEEHHLLLFMTEIWNAQTLYEWRQKAERTQTELLNVAKEIRDTLSSIHTENISWNDLHASNILLDSANTVYLIDAEFASIDPDSTDFDLDIRMFGRLLLWLVYPVDTLLDWTCRIDVFIQKLEQSNYPQHYIDAVHIALCQNRGGRGIRGLTLK
ncbi:protein kinase family protein [Candidatus Poribacteria bacterium]|nr:protein kinase family protein [Candidatus Poribacteria bacterium]